MRRAGWRVYFTPEATGSYEECPPSLLDFATRDWRWCQGNLQHSRIVPAIGLHWMSRLHLIMGIMWYVASPLWLIFIVLGYLLTLQAHFIRPEYFTENFALFPAWPIFDPERAMWLFLGTMLVLVAPKLFSYILLCKDREIVSLCGGRFRAGISVLFETLLSVLIAPLMMLMRSVMVTGIITDRSIGWYPQHRDDGSIPLRSVVRRHLVHTLLGAVFAISAYSVSPLLLAWLSPVVLSLLLAIPISAATGRQKLGQAIRRLGLLVTPEEAAPPQVLLRANELAVELYQRRVQITDAFERLANDAELRAIHAVMLQTHQERRMGEYDVDLLIGLAKLADANSVKEASTMLTNREKLALLGHWGALTRLDDLTTT
jgi:membrane glycosyltransferase